MKRCWANIAIDRSGSMKGKEDDVVGGYNNILEEQKVNQDDRWTVFTFDNKIEKIIDCSIQDVPNLTKEQIAPRGSTALFDAIGAAYMNINNTEETYDIITLHIITDGVENSSKNFRTGVSLDALKESISKRHNLKVFFIGADEECLLSASVIKSDIAREFNGDIPSVFRSISKDISHCRSNASVTENYNGSLGPANSPDSKISGVVSEASKVVMGPPPLIRSINK